VLFPSLAHGEAELEMTVSTFGDMAAEVATSRGT
jgi:hypothetical protein